MKWQDATLRRIIESDDLHIAPFRESRASTGTPTWIWCVDVDGELYVRGYHGKRSSRYQAALRQRAGRIIAADLARDVAFEPVEGAVLDRIDEAYRTKYAGSACLLPMVGDGARAATIRIRPRVAS